MYIWVDDHHTHIQRHKKKNPIFLLMLSRTRSMFAPYIAAQCFPCRKFSCHAAAIPLFRPMSTIEQSTHSLPARSPVLRFYPSSQKLASAAYVIRYASVYRLFPLPLRANITTILPHVVNSGGTQRARSTYVQRARSCVPWAFNVTGRCVGVGAVSLLLRRTLILSGVGCWATLVSMQRVAEAAVVRRALENALYTRAYCAREKAR